MAAVVVGIDALCGVLRAWEVSAQVWGRPRFGRSCQLAAKRAGGAPLPAPALTA